jgi:hypothetical protein
MADLRAAVQLQEEKAENGADAFMRGNDAWNEQKEKREKDRKAIDDADDYADKIQNARQQAEQERQERAEAWANSDHTYAGQKMSATEWLRMIQWFKQPENRKAWEDAMMASTGKSRSAVKSIGEKMDRLDALIEKESRGEKLTPEEEAEKRRLNNDKDVQAGMKTRREQMDHQQGMRPEVSNQVDARAAATSSDVTSESATVDSSFDILAGMNVRVSLVQSKTLNASVDGNVADVSTTRTSSVSMQTEGQSEFAANAPSLGASFSAAKAATSPLDISPEPLRVAVASPSPERQVTTSGLDV